MTVFTIINQVLSILKELNHEEIDKFLYKDLNSFNLQINNQTLVEIKAESISLLGKDITSSLTPPEKGQNSSSIELDRIKDFFINLEGSIIRLNHLGINYSCTNINEEISRIKTLLEGTNFKLYEEPNDFPNQKWLFIGNLENWENPLFELAITESTTPLQTKWIPHFQIDLDTKLTAEELDLLTKKYLTANFADWKMDIPDYGIVFEIGELANIHGTKIFQGLGTKLRKTKVHREKILRLV